MDVQFTERSRVAVNAHNNIIVADTNNNQITYAIHMPIFQRNAISFLIGRT